MSHRVLVFALLVALPASLPAQHGGAHDLLRRGIVAYQDLDFELATTLLRRALSGELSDSGRVEALTYLGAAEHYRGRSDSAAAVFRRLIALAPQSRPDTLVFPPEVTRSYADVHSRMDQDSGALVQAPPPPPPPPPAAMPPAQTSLDTSAVFLEQPERGIMATGGATVANVRAYSEAGELPSAGGTVLGIAANARLGRLELGVRYIEGSLGSRDLVEGAAALRFAATPWLRLHAGPQIRRYETPFGAERWMTWQIGGRIDAPIVGTIIRGHALLWQGLGLSVNVAPGTGRARGGEVGVTLDPPAAGPFWFGLSYRIDRATVRGSNRREKVEALTITAGLRRRP